MNRLLFSTSVAAKIICLVPAIFFIMLTVGVPAETKTPSFHLSVTTEGTWLHLAWEKQDNTQNCWLLYSPVNTQEDPVIKVLALGNMNRTSCELWPGAAYMVSIAMMDDSGALHFSNVEQFTIRKDPPATQASLIPFQTDQDMLAYLKKGMTTYTAPSRYYDYIDTPSTDIPKEEVRQPSDSDQNNRIFSTTNIQESGVDEADIIKTDGYHLYMISEAKADPLPIDEQTASGLAALQDQSTCNDQVIRILAISADPAGAVETGAIHLQNQDVPVEGLYLVLNRGDDKPDLLITIGGQATDYGRCWYNPWCWNKGQTEVGFYNVTDPFAPVPVTRLTLDGQLISSRRIQHTLHLVTRYTPAVSSFTPFPGSVEETERNKTLLDQVSLETLLPGFFIDGKPSGTLVHTTASYLPPLYQDMPPQPSLITLTSIDLNHPSDPPETVTIAGPTETVYASAESLYLASTRTRQDVPIILPAIGTPEPDTMDRLPGPSEETTDIHKFNLSVHGPIYTGSGTVPGHLGWENTKKPYRLSDYQGVLRIATSLGNSWDGSAHTRLTLLKEDQDQNTGNLVEISHIDHIGEPGESLYAARYAGPRAYLVTFQVTDPLYVFDLSDPFQPKTLGELHMEGYSDYLHPITEDLLLGIGKDAVPDTGATDFNGRGAWYQGLKLALFDVSDPSTPTEIRSMIIGKRGTSSDLLYDHHALAFLPPLDGQPARLAIPVDLHDTVPDHDSFDPRKPWSGYDWTHTGLYMFEIDSGPASGPAHADLRLAGTLVVETRQADQTYPEGHRFTDRAVLLNNSVHYVHNADVWSAQWGKTDDQGFEPE